MFWHIMYKHTTHITTEVKAALTDFWPPGAAEQAENTTLTCYCLIKLLW